MKRVFLAFGIVLIIIGISVLALCDMRESLRLIAADTKSLREEAERLSEEEVTARCYRLSEQWDKMEGRFLLYVRHDHLDAIMEHLAELPAFSEKQEYAELFSNLDASLRMMEHLWESVKPSYRTLL